MKLTRNNPRFTEDMLGPYLPLWLDIAERNPAPLAETLGALYTHGGGWDPFQGFMLGEDNSLKYPGDPAQHPVCTWEMEGEHVGETVCFYRSEWVAIIQADRSYEVCRMD